MKCFILILSLGLFLTFGPREAWAAKSRSNVVKKMVKAEKAKTVAAKKKAPVKKKIEEVVIASDALVKFGKMAGARGAKSKMPQIDILNAIFLFYRDDSALVNGRKRLMIKGEDFSRACMRLEHLSGNGREEGWFQSQAQPQAIQYRNFKSILLYCSGGKHRLHIELNKPYTQEIPYTFGASIKLAQKIEGTLFANDKGSVTEVVFDHDRAVLFLAPGIAFFIPNVFTRAAMISEEEGEMVGYVIGRPENSPERRVAVQYNLTTCAKSSIGSDDLSPEEYWLKLAGIK
jgi:hypothetical protein